MAFTNEQLERYSRRYSSSKRGIGAKRTEKTPERPVY